MNLKNLQEKILNIDSSNLNESDQIKSKGGHFYKNLGRTRLIKTEGGHFYKNFGRTRLTKTQENRRVGK